MHVHSQGKLHVWRLNVVNAGAVDCFYDGPDLGKGLMQREPRDLPKNSGQRQRTLMTRLMTTAVTRGYPHVSQQVLEFVAVTLGRVPPLAQLQFRQELFQDGGAVAVPVGRLARPPLHDLVFHDLLDSVEVENIPSTRLPAELKKAAAELASPEAPLRPLCLGADTPTPLADK